jgi:disulfide bond formation protein DsbB
MRFAPRWIFAAIFAATAMLIAFAMYLQHELGLEPCPMCILQRYLFMAIAAVALLAAIHAPKCIGLKAYGALVALFALVGGGTAVRHSYLQRFPDESTSCMGTDLEFLINNFPLAQALPKIFAGTGECAKVQWRFLWLSIPEWALVWFVILAAVALWASFKRRG